MNHLGIGDFEILLYMGPIFGTRELVHYELHAVANKQRGKSKLGAIVILFL